MSILARLSRIVPGIIILAVLAGIIYLVVTYRYSPAKAKEILIKLFTWITGIVSAFFGLVCLYALIESNEAVLDLAFGFLVAGLIGLGIVQICRYRFIKHNPHYKDQANTKAKVKHHFPWEPKN